MTSDYSVIVAASGVGSLDNAGSVTSTNASAFDTSAVAFYQSGTVTNMQTGSLSADTGVLVRKWLGDVKRQSHPYQQRFYFWHDIPWCSVFTTSTKQA